MGRAPRAPLWALFRTRHAAWLGLPEIAFFVAGFQYRAVLHHDTEPSGEVQRSQQPFHRGRQHLGGPHFAAEFSKIAFFVFVGLSCNRDLRLSCR